jgi:glycosyltransferase involved in cell wall biosynthesis
MAVSLVIPLRNEEASLLLLIESILRQARPPDEVVLVDGGSTDRTVSLARELTAGRTGFSIIEAGPATPGRGRNVGIAAAMHSWIALTDAGIQLEPTWLEALVDAAGRGPAVDVVYGNFEIRTRSFFDRCAALAYPPPKRDRPNGRMRGPSIASALIRREVWQALGGFPDLRAAEDIIFLERVHERGFVVGWAPGATVWWQLQPNLVKTYRRFALYSEHNVRAGRQRNWHYGVLRQYLLACPFLALSMAAHPGWAVVPLLGAAARVARSIWARREGRGLPFLLNPAQFLLVGVILATIDLATFVGWARALRHRSQGEPSLPPAALSELQP